MDAPPATTRQAFEEAVGFLLATVERVPPDQWTAPALGEWCVRDLVGHASRSLITTEAFLENPAATVDFAGPAEYMATVLAQPGAMARAAENGRQAGAALGDDPPGALRALAARALPRIAAADGAQPITTPAGGTRLDDYLATRVFELVIHTLDLGTAIRAGVEPPPNAARLTLALAGDIALRTGKAPDLLLALSGRRPLPAGFSIV
ncbi:MAG TPA: maleylpyruvate isomerase N-terminal domain-containing protein [Chloroflexota bacterium]|jgi:uncharacterized protein (TIGR03083 family)